MMRAAVVWFTTAVAVAVAVSVVPGIGFASEDSLIQTAALAAVLAVLNSFVKPVMQIVALPVSVLTLGVFALVVNAFVLYLAKWIGNGVFGTGFYIDNFGSAFVAAVVISLVAAVLNRLTGVKGRPLEPRP
jgi:putative membrane protein